MAEKGVLYMIPCPISDQTEVYDVVPEANRRVIDSLDYFIVENVRSARRFLSKAQIARKIDELEFVELNEHTVAGQAVEAMIKPLLAGRSAGVISEVSQIPGHWLSRRVIVREFVWCRLLAPRLFCLL